MKCRNCGGRGEGLPSEGLPSKGHRVSKGKEICSGKTRVHKQTLLGHRHGETLCGETGRGEVPTYTVLLRLTVHGAKLTGSSPRRMKT